MKKTLLLMALNALVFVPAFAQDKAAARDEFWVCPAFESVWYGISKAALGGGAALGYGDGVALGLKAMYFDDMNEFRTVELNFLLRFYPLRMAGAGPAGHPGLFLQLNGGPVVFAHNGNGMAVPSRTGTFSGGLGLGWRFHLGRRFFLEPAVRGGYPYMAGAGLSAGVRF
jgi:hypothetical protein